MPKQFQFLRWQGKRAVALLVLTISLASTVVLGTVAFIMDSTGVLTNIFTPAQLSSAPDVNGSAVDVKNTGDVEGYLRAAIVVNWVDQDGNIYSEMPAATDYTMTYGDGWTQGSDGFWYYPEPVPAASNAPAPLIAGYTVSGESIPSGYELSVEVVTSAIQAEPTSVVRDTWNVTVSGTTITPN